MGSPTESSAKPVPMEDNTDKKSFKSRFKFLFRKKKDKVEKTEHKRHEQQEPKKETNNETDDVKLIVDKIEKIDIKDKEDHKEESVDDEEENELGNFNIKVITVSRNERIHSHSSGDSGFSEKSDNSDKSENSNKSESCDKLPDCENTDKCVDLAEGFEKLELDDENKKTKKLQKVILKRGPTRNKVNVFNRGCPYPNLDTDPYRQVSKNTVRVM